MSIIKPTLKPIINLIKIILINNIILACSAIKIGIISSLVDKYTENSVPREMILVTYKLVAATEKPHWGIIPRKLPINGPNFPEEVIILLFFFT